MARRVNPAAGAAATEEHKEQTPLEGGSSGILPDTLSTSGIPGQVTGSAERPVDPNAPPPPVVKKYVVEGQRGNVPGYHVQEKGMLTLIRTGRIVDDSNFDVDGLRRQGVRLRALDG